MGLAHMSAFMAGAVSRGVFAGSAEATSDTTSPVRPWARRAIMSAEHGAITRRSHHRATPTCCESGRSSLCQMLVSTLWPERACSVNGAMNRIAASVISTRTSAPSLLDQATHDGGGLIARDPAGQRYPALFTAVWNKSLRAGELAVDQRVRSHGGF